MEEPRGGEEVLTPNETSTKRLLILVDMDNTLSKYNESAVRRYEEMYKPKKSRFLSLPHVQHL